VSNKNACVKRVGEFQIITGAISKKIKIADQLEERKLGVEGSKIENRLVIIFN
jgi:hypothetical protein